jgi:hypothetical protein
MASKHIKRCSTSLAIREMQIKKKLYQDTISPQLSLRKQETTNSGKNVWRKEPLYTVGGNVY